MFLSADGLLKLIFPIMAASAPVAVLWALGHHDLGLLAGVAVTLVAGKEERRHSVLGWLLCRVLACCLLAVAGVAVWGMAFRWPQPAWRTALVIHGVSVLREALKWRPWVWRPLASPAAFDHESGKGSAPHATLEQRL